MTAWLGAGGLAGIGGRGVQVSLRVGRWQRDRAEWAGLVLVLALGAWLRLGWAGVSSFAFDEAR